MGFAPCKPRFTGTCLRGAVRDVEGSWQQDSLEAVSAAVVSICGASLAGNSKTARGAEADDLQRVLHGSWKPPRQAGRHPPARAHMHAFLACAFASHNGIR